MPERYYVPGWARDITESVLGPAPFGIGDVVVHPDGRRVQIIDGCYWAPAGLSNHWNWREVFADGTLGALEQGYGWRPESSSTLH